MKAFFIIALSSILVIGCSRNPKAEALLNSAEELTGQNPDSALRILDSVDVEILTRKQQMRYYLVHASAQNKAYIPFTSDSIMKEVVEYYDSHGTPNEQMLANYLMGRIYTDMDNPMVALEYFHNAIERADTTSNDCDYKTLSRIYGQTADLFHMQLLPEYELRDEKLAVKYAWKAKDTLAALQFYEHLTGPYDRMNMKDSVISVSKNVSNLYRQYGYKEEASSCWPSAIYVYMEQKKYAEAKLLINDMIKNSGWTDKNGDFTEKHKGCYDIMGLYYEGINKLDSAEYFYRKVLTLPLEMPNHEISIKGLMSIYKKKHYLDSVSKYARMYCEYNDSSYMALSTDKVRRMQAIYDYSHNQKIAIQKTIEAKNNLIRLEIFVSITFILIVLTIYIIYIKKKKKDEILRNTQNKNLKIRQQYYKAKEEYAQLIQNYEEYKIRKHDEIERLRDVILRNEEKENTLANIDNEELLQKAIIVKRFHECSSLGKLPSSKEWADLNRLVERFIPNFIKFLKENDNELSFREIEICILIRLGFKSYDIKVLLDLSSQYLSNIRTSINIKLFKTKGTKDLDYKIRCL